MNITLQELTVAVEGELIGDPALTISGAASLLEATVGEITFFADPRYKPLLERTQATAVFVPVDFTEEIRPAQIRVANPRKAFEQIVLKLARPAIRFAAGIHPTAVVADDAKIGVGVSIQPCAVVEAGVSIGDKTVIGAHSYVGHESVIGPGSVIYPQVTIRERTIIGARVTLHSGVVIGADGFGFEVVAGVNQKIPQIGIVQIDDDVEIGANTTIDRARFGRTWIKEGAKIDNLVMIAHNVVIGRHAIIAAQAGIAGSARVGDNVMIGGQAGITGHVEVGDRVQVGAKAGVSKNVPSDTGVWWGIPAVPMRDAHEQLAWIRRLGKLFARVKAIEQGAAIKNDPR